LSGEICALLEGLHRQRGSRRAENSFNRHGGRASLRRMISIVERDKSSIGQRFPATRWCDGVRLRRYLDDHRRRKQSSESAVCRRKHGIVT
jgi:hypothetical protein